MTKKIICILLLISILLFSSCRPNESNNDILQTENNTEAESTTGAEDTEPAAPETELETETESSAPETTFPETTIPVTTIPETTAPVTTIPETTAPVTTIPETTTPETTAPDTTAAITTAPPAPPAEPELDPNLYIGSLYTVRQLNNLDKTKKGYGQGLKFDENNRPLNSVNLQNTYGQYNTAFIAPESNNVYLTFDLGYENGYTNQILDVLNAKNVKGVFFATLSYCKNNPAIVSRIINEGHTLGNHSVSHLSMPTLSLMKMESEIMDMHNYILNNYGYTMTLFRPPMGEFSEQSLAVTQSLGYKTVHWSFAYLDYDTSNQPEYNYALERVTGAAHGGAIYLLHAVSATNTAILPAVIDNLISRGYTISLFA